MTDEVVKQFGFDSVAEFHRMVSSVDMSDFVKLEAFSQWQFYDGSKAGLQTLPKRKE